MNSGKEFLVRVGFSALLGMAACEDDKPKVEPPPIVRTVATPIPTPIILELEPAPPLAEIGEQVKRVDIADKIRAIEEENGKKEITFEQARQLVSLVTKLYQESTGSSIITEEINKMVFILHDVSPLRIAGDPDEPPLSDIEMLSHVKNLRIDYPDAKFDENIIRRLARASRSSGFVEGGYVFLNFDQANGESVTVPAYPFYPKNQYFDIAVEINCAPLGPTSALRKILLHEYFHRDSYEQRIPVDPDFKPVFASAKGWIPPVIPVEQYGFGIIGRVESENGPIYPVELFEEIGADYIAAKVSVINGLGYDSSDYAEPRDLYNFRQMLSQAGIDDQTFLKLHREGQLKEFMIKIGKAALLPVGIHEDPLTLAFTLAKDNIASLRISWRLVQNYFPTVSTAKSTCR